MRAFRTVVLPPPEGPTRATNSPGATSRFTPLTAADAAPGYVCPNPRAESTAPFVDAAAGEASWARAWAASMTAKA